MKMSRSSAHHDHLIDSFQQLSIGEERQQSPHATLAAVPRSFWSWADILSRSERWDLMDSMSCTHRPDSYGNTLLIAAASFGNDSCTTRLISQGANVNAKNFLGRTPLMEASLWGRLSIVQLLLARSANIDLTDDEGNRAFNLAKPVELNSYERYERGTKEHIIERPWLDEQHRLKILELLSPGEGCIVANKSAEARINYAFFDRSLDGKYTNLVLKYFPTKPDPAKRPKTVARIVDGSVAVDAMSGWGHDDQYTIPGSLTWEVLKFAKENMVEFPAHENDKRGFQRGPEQDFETQQSVEGSYYASHAEPQAIVQYLKIKRICVDVEAVNGQATGTGPSAIRDVQLIVSNKVCPICMGFMSHVNSITRRSAKLQFVAWERYVADNGELVARKVELVVRGPV
ncbi:hypothetical protein T440DRAFT_498093 [Plenodomus tracheiphilus IPT5]|uniref:Single-strand DNA deaminase toxin A-like C-terminal domain-containing protein n=1 Tax=Plenodomus tracheiphilus IPT5 TaxID=1408161 RepID=A0A6A7BC96_9PLEO|nr:hypothetical protein T440DRAFT_498093 [Plenodomus tracheiphilus IPT5]